MAWIVSFSESARKDLKKLDRQLAARIDDFLVHRVAVLPDAREAGKALTGEWKG